MNTTKPLVFVSACLLGHKVRFDGQNQYNAMIIEILSQQFQLKEICPEVAIGMGIPRPPIQLIKATLAPKAVQVDQPEVDMTEKLESYALSQVTTLNKVSGIILKKNSPSCGVDKVKIHDLKLHDYVRQGVGIFTRTIIKKLPSLPMVDEQMLENLDKRSRFIQQVQERSEKIRHSLVLDHSQ